MLLKIFAILLVVCEMKLFGQERIFVPFYPSSPMCGKSDDRNWKADHRRMDFSLNPNENPRHVRRSLQSVGVSLDGFAHEGEFGDSLLVSIVLGVTELEVGARDAKHLRATIDLLSLARV
jgi:hypothetical protein